MNEVAQRPGEPSSVRSRVTAAPRHLHPAAYAARLAGYFMLLSVSAGTLTAGESRPIQRVDGATITLDAKIVGGKLEIPHTLASLTLTVKGEAPFKVKTSAKWMLLESSETKSPDGGVLWRGTYLVEPPALDAAEWQLDPIKIQVDDDEQTITWKPWPVHVYKAGEELDVKDLRDKTLVETVSRAKDSSDAWIYWLAGGVAAACLGGLVIWWRRRRAALALTAEQWACRELDRLLALNLPARAEVERFHTLLSNIVRRFLERQYLVRARRQTTPEFLHAMTSDSRFTPAQQELLRDFLQRCDVGKFAGIDVAATECQALAQSARQFIKQAAAECLQRAAE
jgi:Domain of unknown function (DUF4381)